RRSRDSLRLFVIQCCRRRSVPLRGSPTSPRRRKVETNGRTRTHSTLPFSRTQPVILTPPCVQTPSPVRRRTFWSQSGRAIACRLRLDLRFAPAADDLAP